MLVKVQILFQPRFENPHSQKNNITFIIYFALFYYKLDILRNLIKSIKKIKIVISK